MELSELFLIVWACLATAGFVFTAHHLKKATKGAIILCMVIEAVAQGKSELKSHADGRITIDMGDHTLTLRGVDA